jgi:glycosyltransferase involved in cell wall biosynthesis
VKVLVFAHRLEIGGTQTNAIELAAALRDLHGHDVVLFATPGPALQIARQRGLRFLPAPEARFHPSPARARALREVVRQERPDLIHAWDWWQCMDAYYAVHLLMGIPMIVSDMMMCLTRMLPRELPTTFGTPELADQARRAGWRRAAVMLPPVDVRYNAPNAVDTAGFRARHGITDRDVNLVTVSRLSSWMKLESLLGTIDAVRRLGRELPLRLLIVGGGSARVQLERAASEANRELQREGVVLTGPMIDPRPAYASADVVVGMGSSALRGMAFGKPVVVVGERGFCEALTADSADRLLYKGIYGQGDGSPMWASLAVVIRALAQDRGRFEELGAFSRDFVERHFKLEAVCAGLAALCEGAVRQRPRPVVAAADAVRTAAVYLRHRAFLIPSTDAKPSARSAPEAPNA